MGERKFSSVVALIVTLGLLLNSSGGMFAATNTPIQSPGATTPDSQPLAGQPAGMPPEPAPASLEPEAMADTKTVTLTTSGFSPATMIVMAGTQVVWYNATAQTQFIASGVPYQIFLPLVMRSGTREATQPIVEFSPPVLPEESVGGVSIAAGESFSGTLPAGGTFTHTFDAAGSYPYYLTTSPKWRGLVVAQSNIPPDPSTVAPPVDPTVATTLISATKFLYTGPNPIQTGVVSGTIQPLRVAVLRGKVLTREGAALPGVTISILDHPEFGQTLSRLDGMFDMAVNGGSQVTVKYEKQGYLPLQRQVDVPWQDYVWLPDVALIAVDPNVTTIDLTSNQMQVARASIISDTRGVRQETLLFPIGTTAVMSLPNGITQTLTTLHVRSTEYTIGPNGEKAMPAELPANSAYTYATEFSVDEVTSAGGTGPSFSQPIISYNENFLSFPVGITVPVGYYDRGRGVWVASDNGRVVKILSITGGKANLDIDGGSTPANAAALAALGVSDDERIQLTTLYTIGQSLWRTPVSHFSAWDSNQGTSCQKPCPDSPQPRPQFPSLDNPNCQPGSIISCQSQTLGEMVDVTGTPFYLHYQSDRVPGNRDAYSLLIPLSGPDPTSLGTATRIEVHIYVAGQSFSHSFSPATTNLVYRFTWDGRDAYGRAVQGKQPIAIQNCYVYPLVYQTTNRFGHNGDATTFLYTSGRDFLLCKQWQGEIGAWNSSAAEGLGSWSLNVHHSYDPIGRVLYLGDGERRSTLNVSQVITTIAGGPQAYNTADGIPATQAYLDNVADVIVAPDGSLFLSELLGQRVRKIDANGIITTVAGIYVSYGYNGDAIPATQAKLDRPAQLALGPDGSLYIADSFNNRIRRVSPDGIISTVAGTGDYGFSGDGGPATQAKLNNPKGVAVAPDGSLYIADSYNNSIRRVTTDGLISTVAGTGDPYWGFSGDGGPATQARLAEPDRVAVAPDGKLYTNDLYNSRIRQVRVDGIITTTAGTGGSGSYCDGCPATESQVMHPLSISVAPDGSLYLGQSDPDFGTERVRRIAQDGTILTIVGGANYCGTQGDGGPALNGGVNNPDGVAQAPDGTLYIATHDGCSNGALRKVAPILPAYSNSAIAVASANGSELYVFDQGGRHLRTVDSLTGVTLYQFGYNSVGLLVTVTDHDGNVTTIERDATGKATGIVGPYGQRTSLATDANGYLASLTNPAGEAYHLASTADGLLTTFTDPKGHVHHFAYDDLGRLIRDDDPAGGYKTLVRTDLNPNFTVTLTSALSRTTQYQVNYPTTGGLDEINTLPSGITTTFRMALDGTNTHRAADGTLSTSQLAPDPRWGLQAPLGSLTLATPGGLVASYAMTRSMSLSDPTNLLTLATQVDTQTVNGRAYLSTYTAAGRAFTSTTPMGRQEFANLDTLGRVVQAQTAGLLPTRLGYDSHGRVITATQGTGNEARAASLSYNSAGYLQTITDPLGRIARFDYDAAGRVITQTLPDGRVIGYHYDANGNLASLTPPGRLAHRFTYTPIDLNATYTPPSIGTALTQTVYSYNADRQLTRVTRPDGQTVSFGYDNAGRLSGVTFARGAYTYAYNPATGNLSSIGAPGGINLAYTFDGPFPTGETLSGPVAGQVARTYDNDFRVTHLGINGVNVPYTYDTDSLLIGAGDLNLSRDAHNGLITGSTLGNVSDGRSYDGFGEVISYSAAYNGANLFAQQYNYDKLGRITAKTETISGTTTVYSYTYDLPGRLSAVARNGATISSYSYDSNGNRLSYSNAGGVITGTYDAQDRLLHYGTATYNYTANGELLTKTVGAQTTAYQYDALGNLMAVTLPSGTPITYLVDGRNRRIGKRVNGTLVQGFLYEDSLRPAAELDGSGNVVSRFVYASRSNVPDYVIKGGSTYRIVADQLGSPRLVVDVATGAIAQRMDYDEFGVVLTDTNPSFQPFGFAGGLYDHDTGLVRFGTRDYDPTVGRWTAKDLIRFAGGDTNLYGYTLNDPVNHLDQNGLQSKCGKPEGGSECDKSERDFFAPPPYKLKDFLGAIKQDYPNGWTQFDNGKVRISAGYLPLNRDRFNIFDDCPGLIRDPWTGEVGPMNPFADWDATRFGPITKYGSSTPNADPFGIGFKITVQFP